MKAKEYFRKYDEAVWAEAHDPEIHTDGPMAKMFIEFTIEMKEILNKRNVKFDKGVWGVIRDQNEKWNAVMNLFIKKYGETPITRDGFKTGIMQELDIKQLQ